jgi:phytoene dehydrogenase-like protein
MTNLYDVAIIGGGHNGIVTAALLAAKGLAVVVLERREIVGGACVTEEIYPGFRFSTAAYLVSLLQQPVVDELDLPRFGYRVDPKDPAFFSPYPDGRTLTMWQDPKRTVEEISRFSSRDAEAYPRYSDYVDRLARIAEPLLLQIPPQATLPLRENVDAFVHTRTADP